MRDARRVRYDESYGRLGAIPSGGWHTTCVLDRDSVAESRRQAEANEGPMLI